MSDVECAFQVERVGQRNDIGGISVHLMTRRRLCRPSVSTSIVRDDPIALREEEQHLIVPVIGAQRPAMVEDNRLCPTRAPILIEDSRAIRRRYCVHW